MLMMNKIISFLLFLLIFFIYIFLFETMVQLIKEKNISKCVDSNTHKWYNNNVIGKGVQRNSIRTTKMTVTVDDFLDMLIDRGSQKIEIYSFMQGRTVFSGYDDDMDFEFKDMTVSSFEIFNDKLVINVDDEC